MHNPRDRYKCPPPPPPHPCPPVLPPPPGGKPVTQQDLESLWDHIKMKFATQVQVATLADQIQKLEMGMNISATQVAQAAAAIVLKSLESDLEQYKGMKVHIVPMTDENGLPNLQGIDVDYSTLYLTPADQGSEEGSNFWDEWIAIPIEVALGSKPVGAKYKWERVAYQKPIDLSFVHEKFEEVNQAIANLENKMNTRFKRVNQNLIEKAIKPLNQLREYLKSEEFTQYLQQAIPAASLTEDGLMTKEQALTLSTLYLWATQDQEVPGGGACGPDVVINLLKENNIPVDDLEEIY